MNTATALWHLSRPKMLPYLWVLLIFGFGWAHWDRALSFRGGGSLTLLLLAWTALHAGTLWLNAAVDQDEGEVLFGSTVSPPASATAWGYVALAMALLFSAPTGPIALFCCAVCVVFAVLYSNPRTLWKGNAVMGPITNLLGYGWLTPLAGWSVVAVSMNLRTVAVFFFAGFTLLGVYFAAQAFQGREDKARGYRTLAATHGPRATVAAARAFVFVSILGGSTLAIFGWLPRICLLGVLPFLLSDAYAAEWMNQPNGGNERWAQGYIKRLAGSALSWFLLAFLSYTVHSWSGSPVAGLGTAAGHPSDRPILGAAALAAWERIQGQ